ncbi:HesB/IscA family protein [Acuticoccus sediminis]|uniref:HesB/IscA family protein n=1 Tax=Acuticoccus sediminis TaxID=2184697 RepID=UPI001CFD60FB|nr:iron-sulfur cluster assembly accessory protein [Acuticoccus sediminis]
MSFELTRSAERFIRMMIMTDGKPGSGFRLAVTPGGCSGLNSDVAVVDAPAEGEQVVEKGSVRLFLNAESRILLDGVTIDFADTPLQTGLVFHDPKATGSCSSH